MIHPHGERWLLRGDIGGRAPGDDETPLAGCLDLDGVFVDLPPRPHERFTLVDCVPEGALADALREPGRRAAADLAASDRGPLALRPAGVTEPVDR
ncbi:hypothetical protein J2S43_004948 [Catenuloplanes nepalensis]|uniref:Uncharacterized protein n=1 Tax=Catenuloplanes nepalensis TaxID=587533 RepID=A0ABT9MYC1_9ACTN|nr:hypothetical protein [Catenuloplanes nepalensis]MDP9796436.1 hypothetical protein [Catenuloplanes nepalensis]